MYSCVSEIARKLRVPSRVGLRFRQTPPTPYPEWPGPISRSARTSRPLIIFGAIFGNARTMLALGSVSDIAFWSLASLRPAMIASAPPRKPVPQVMAGPLVLLLPRRVAGFGSGQVTRTSFFAEEKGTSVLARGTVGGKRQFREL